VPRSPAAEDGSTAATRRALSGVSLPDRYRVCAHIANGGMASVWAVEDQLLDRIVAVKILAAHFAEDPQFVRRFEREARAAASFSGHPNVIAIYDVGEHDGRPFIVMERLTGGTVADALRNGRPIGHERALRWLREAASALDEAHERGIVHRDVKPANMLLDARLVLKLADFGIARLAYEDSVTATGLVLGTAAYLSPEQAMGRPAAAASDRYALGVIAHELLTGSRPFTAENFTAQARQHVEADPPRASEVRSDLPREVDDVLLRAMAKDAGDRWPTARAFVEALEAALAGERTRQTALMGAAAAPAGAVAAAESAATATPEPRPPELAPAYRREQPGRRRAALLAGGALAALAALVLALAVLGGEPASEEGTDEPAAPAEEGRVEQPEPEGAAPAEEQPPAAGAEEEAPPEAPADSEDASARELNDRGFALMQAGDHAAAVPLLRQAVERSSPGEDGNTHIYALYNLGRSLRLNGQPEEAIPVLERRLRFDDQRSTVQAELDAARRDAGRTSGSRDDEDDD
jgi:eukaryotic-like serine/threonine-protein kinase